MSSNEKVRPPQEIEDEICPCGEVAPEEEAHLQKEIAQESGRAQHAEGAEPPLRIGVYICRCGGNISDVVDVERVAETVRLIPGVTTAKVHTFVCSDPGQHMISNDILE